MENFLIPAVIGERKIWLRVGTLLDGVSTKPLRNANVVYGRNEIFFVGENLPPANFLNPNQRQPDLDLPEFTLLPGLIEAHAHFFLEGGELNLDKRAAYLKQTPEKLLELAKTRLEKLVRLGIIAVRDAGDKDGVSLALSKLYASGNHPLMPYVDSPGAAIHHQGRYGSFMAEPIENFPSLKNCVESRVKLGADRIKLIPTGIINFKKGAVTTEPQMTTEEIRELVTAAKSFGKQTFAHASGDIGIERAIDGGVDSIEHGFFVRDDQLAKMRDRQIAWVPTFAPVQEQVNHADLMGWDSQVVAALKKILEQHTKSLVRVHEMGVQIIAGSDAGSYGVAHGIGFLNELEWMERAGLSPLAVINSATGASSNRLAFKEKFGQIKVGFQSRFILTCHSPLEKIPNLRKQKFVVFDGAVFENDENFDSGGL
ncbi:MAG TPA: amidohydrolase family protein [Verrucomicrobiae bacterium]|nr:amidohydrolase family protein [Verrucomicrobiae bacterium]